jgi:amidophosphoribosyltransferase
VLYDGLLLLQHRGQDAAGIVTNDGTSFHMHKAGGYVRDVFRTRNMRDLLGMSASATAAIRRQAARPPSSSRSRSTSIRRSASRSRTTAISRTARR